MVFQAAVITGAGYSIDRGLDNSYEIIMRKHQIRNRVLQAQIGLLILVAEGGWSWAQQNLGSVEELRHVGKGGFGSRDENVEIKTLAKEILYRKSDTVLSATTLTALRPVILGVGIPGFGDPGETIWEVRFGSLYAPDDTIHAIIWVDEDAKRGLGLMGSWERVVTGDNTGSKYDRVTYEQEELPIEGDEAVARVLEAMQKRLGALYDAEEVVGRALMWEMGYSVPEFCNLKDIVWEVRIAQESPDAAPEGAILAVALVNGLNGSIRWLASPGQKELEILERERKP